VLTQVAAEAIGIDYDDIVMAASDTGLVPIAAPPSHRERDGSGRLIEPRGLATCNHVARACRACERYTPDEFFAACGRYRAQRGEVVSLVRYEAPPESSGRPEVSRRSLPSYAWSIHMAQVAVDMVTFSAEVEEFWRCRRWAGLNPVLATGQIEGGIAQGIGYALYEKVVCKMGTWPTTR